MRSLALAIAALVLTLGAAELLLRASGRFPTAQLHSVSSRDHARIPGPWQPNQDLVRLAKPALPHRVRTNALGLRGPETSLAPRGPRVLCVGDSFTFGDFVEDDETLPAQLGARLGPSVEVLNAGVGGTTVVDQRALLEGMLALEPDLVLLTYSENDLDDLRLDPAMHERLTRNRELKDSWLGPIYALARDTNLFYLALRGRAVWGAFRAGAPASPVPEPTPQVGEVREPAPRRKFDALVERYAAEVEALDRELRARGIAFVFAAYPSHYNVDELRNDATIPPLLDALAGRGIEGIDLTPALRASGLPGPTLYLLPEDGHPSARGYAIAATALAPQVAERLMASKETSSTR